MKITNIILAACLPVMLGSCSLLSPKNNTIKGSDGIINNNKETSSSQKVTSTSDIADKLSGEWVITAAGTTRIPPTDEMPYITFEKATGRFYASNGCNILNGAYSVNADGRISFANILSTMKYCADLGYDTLISSAISETAPLTAKIDRVGQESFLRLYDSKGNELITAKKHNMDFLNGNWNIETVGGKATTGDDVTMFIDITELKIHGNTGCNYFNGELFINPDKANAIDFSNLVTTRMACQNMEQESAILLALEETVTAIAGSDNRVMFLNSAGKELMTIRRAAATEE